jgi:GMP reductase
MSMEKATWCSQNDIFYALHRFYPYHEINEWVRTHQHLETVSISIGVQEKDVLLIEDLAEAGYKIDFITVDIAHGHSAPMERAMDIYNQIYSNYEPPFRPNFICGNATTSQGVNELVKWGANAVKVGIGQGHVCTTRLQTGFGVPMVTALQECCDWVDKATDPRDLMLLDVPDVPIIADGGISHFGDVAKALRMGATMVMAGSMFARCIDSPAETIGDGFRYGIKKRWFGSASEFNKGNTDHIEGIECIEHTNGMTYKELICNWKQALQSSISYAGGTDLNAFKNVQYIVV